ncbi:g8140 [Coccomyxa elongata]
MSANGDAAVPRLPAPPFKTCLLWFRRDLRVSDNPALIAAVQAATTVVPVYVWAPEEEGQFQPGRCSRWWLHQSLQALEKDFAALGTSMVYRRSPESRTALIQLVEEAGAQALFFNHLYDPISLVRDNEVKATMVAMNVHCQSFNGDVLYEPWEVLAEGGRPFTTFASFWARMSKMPYPPPIPLPVPAAISPVPPDIVNLELDSVGLMSPEEQQSNQQLYHSWSPGGKGAHARLEIFVTNRLHEFSTHRAKTDRESTSGLSPHIHYGEISNRHIYYVAKRQEAKLSSQDGGWADSTKDFLRQMGYREYARYLSFHFPFTHERSLLEHLRAAPWNFDQRLFKAWRQGRTGYPLVDAGMRQLWSSGWLHNRSRVVCASFLVKNLLLPWQWGLKHYWDALLDADLECAALGWQYVSGCLADAHPFSYLLDLPKESLRFDPDGNYVRRWLPVLARMPVKYIHRPWEAPEHVLQDAGVELGVNYPYPVVTTEESEATLARASEVIQQSIVTHNSDVPYRPASDPSALRASHSAPTPDSVEMPGVHGKRRRGQADTAERTAGAFQAAAARARNPEYRGYDRAERRAGLAGEGAQVPQASYAGRLAGEGGSPEVEGAAAAPTYNGATEDGDGVDDEAAFSAMRKLETLSDEVVMSNNVSAMCIGRDDTNATSRALRARGGAQSLLAPGRQRTAENGVASAAEEGEPAVIMGADEQQEGLAAGDTGADAEVPSAEAVVPCMSADHAVVPGSDAVTGSKRRCL